MDNFRLPLVSGRSSHPPQRFSIPEFPKPRSSSQNDHVERKKKVVADLMALRRMKLMQNPRRKSNDFNFKEIITPKIELNENDVNSVLEGTTMKEDLDKVYGEESIRKATEHFSAIGTDLARPDSSEESNRNRKHFLETLTEKRRRILEEKQQKRVVKQEALFERQNKLEKLSKSSITLNKDDLNHLVDDTKQKLKGMELDLKYLKLRYGVREKTSNVFRSQAAFEYFRSTHVEQVGIVDSIIDIILDNVMQECVPMAGNSDDSEILKMLFRSDHAQWQNYQENMIKNQIMRDVLQDMVNETCNSMLVELVLECDYLNRLSHVLPNQILVESTNVVANVKKGGSKDDKVVKQSWVGINVNRDRHRRHIWSHTQGIIKEVVAIPEKVAVAAPVRKPTPPIDTGVDAEIISSLEAAPKVGMHVSRTPQMKSFVANEVDFWNRLSVFKPDFSLAPQQSVGVSVTSLTSNHAMIAVGTYRGDMIVYNMLWQPSRPVRAIAFEGKLPDPIADLKWSLDNSRLISLSDTGCIVVWSVALSLSISPSDITSLNIPDSTVQCSQLTALCVLEALKGDLLFHEGPLCENQGDLVLPSKVNFCPMMSFAGAQNVIAVSLKTGDILRCDLTSTIQKRLNTLLNATGNKPSSNHVLDSIVPADKTNEIGQNIPAELLRYHRQPLLHLVFSRNSGDMVTMDGGYNVCQWKHEAQYLNTFGWFVPFRKIHLQLVEEILVPNSEDQVIFIDEAALKKGGKGKKQKSKKIVEKERQTALRELQETGVFQRPPWHTDEFPDDIEKPDKSKKPSKFVTEIYAPPVANMVDASAGGINFYVIMIKRDTRVLVQYAIRTFETSSMAATKLLHSAVAPSGDRIYLMLLYGEHPPKVKNHISFLDFNIKEMTLGQHGTVRIDISKEKFEKCSIDHTCTLSVSRVYEPLGTEYILCNINGSLSGFSVLSGSKVIHSPLEKDKPATIATMQGLKLQIKHSRTTIGSRVLLINPDGDTSYIVSLPLLMSKSFQPSKLLRLTDASTHEERMKIKNAVDHLQYWSQSPQSPQNDQFLVRSHKFEQACRSEEWTSREMPVDLYMKMMLYRMLDIVEARATGVRMPQDQRKIIWKKDWLRMEDEFHDEDESNSQE